MEPTSNPKDLWPLSWEMSRKDTTDQRNGIAYLAAYYTLPVGQYYADDSITIAVALNNLSTKGELVDTLSIQLDGNKGKDFVIHAANNVSMKGKYIIRGNRPYMFFVATAREKIDHKDISSFLQSAKLRDFEKATWSNYINQN
ncbi:MAG: hypothetical protein EOO61_14745 [Hymenobacter sp.]|nr:MAG: hypothetical protein EOO61_14745 [Hymenobacter sp.]